jgi:hypothetical protein
MDGILVVVGILVLLGGAYFVLDMIMHIWGGRGEEIDYSEDEGPETDWRGDEQEEGNSYDL